MHIQFPHLQTLPFFSKLIYLLCQIKLVIKKLKTFNPFQKLLIPNSWKAYAVEEVKTLQDVSAAIGVKLGFWEKALYWQCCLGQKPDTVIKAFLLLDPPVFFLFFICQEVEASSKASWLAGWLD